MLAVVVAAWLALAGQGRADPRDWLTAEERAWVAQHPVLRVGGSASYGPFTYVDEDGRITGLSLDYARRLSELTGLRFEFQPPQTFAENLDDLASGELDVQMSMRETPERREISSTSRSRRRPMPWRWHEGDTTSAVIRASSVPWTTE